MNLTMEMTMDQRHRLLASRPIALPESFLNHSAIPALINALAVIETGIEQTALATRKRPAAWMSMIFVVSALGSYTALRRRRAGG